MPKAAAAPRKATRPTAAAPEAPAERRTARERLLAAAAELFYEEGINTVGIDRVIERAGVAKASLYDTFGSKEELVRAYLASRDEARRIRIEARLARYKTPREKILGIFDGLAELFVASDFRGCAFVRADTELRSAPKVKGAVDDARRWLHDLFARLAREAGVAQPERLADKLVLLYDGATVAARMERTVAPATHARSMAEMLLDAERRAKRL